MKSKVKQLAAATALAFAAASPWSAGAANVTGKWVTGYYGGWFWDNADYQAPEHVDMTAMTHFVFGRIGPGGGASGKPGEVVPGGGNAHTERKRGPGATYGMTVEQYLVARAHHAGTKALIMLGGEGDNAGFRASSQPAVRPSFVKNLVDYMVAKNYDGIDVDWEGIDSDNTAEQALLEALITDLRREANSRPRYQDNPVIITFPAGMLNTNIGKVTPHDIRVANMVDQYNFMSYGMGWFGQGWSSTTFAPLTGQTPTRPISIASTIQMYVDAGIARSKLGMGIGFYGMNYTPPFTGPDQPTDGYDIGKAWSVTDILWSYSLLNKHGYLNNGTYVFDRASQTSYRTYPGGYTPATRTGASTGYLSYEEPETIAAKGAWALSTREDEGAAGTIIWLVNYGTTDGVNNPLLTAVKRAFLDPGATEPGPNPNPLPPPPPLAVSVQNTITSDWGSGYCANFKVTNTDTRSGDWTVTQPFKDTITSLWGGVHTLANGTLTLNGPDWHKYVDVGESTDIGYCATRSPKPVEDQPPPPAGTVTARLTITADWTSGYCATVAVTNSGGTKVAGWKVDVPDVQGTLSGLWNGKYTMEGSTMHLSGPDWNPDLAAGATNSDAGFCASR
jgi:GH18 family chitinase